MARLRIWPNGALASGVEITLDGKALPPNTYRYVDDLDIDVKTKLCLTEQER